MTDSQKATIRTVANNTVLTAVAALLYKVFGWEVKVEDLLPFLPIIVPAIGVFYRLSLWVSKKVPALNYILFGGVKATPSYDK